MKLATTVGFSPTVFVVKKKEVSTLILKRHAKKKVNTKNSHNNQKHLTFSLVDFNHHLQ
jgi:hypothetical protein